MGHTYRGPKSGCTIVMLFGGYSYDGVIADVWVIYGSVSAGREKWPFNVLFFFKSRASV